MAEALESLIAAVAEPTKLVDELADLAAIAVWARATVPFQVGDHVRLRDDWSFDLSDAPGWAGSVECLTGGAPASVTQVWFCRYGTPGWRVEIKLDNEWSVYYDAWKGEARRHWYGPVDETPEWCTPPSPYDQERHPDGTRHVWWMRVNEIEAITS